MKNTKSPINDIWFAMVIVAISVAIYNNRLDEINSALFSSAKAAVTLALGLIGPMAFWLGIMKIAEVGGLTQIIARALRPVMVRLFPDVPSDHPAMGSMIMNMAANMLGLGNAATPMGIKAMQELSELSPEKGTATDSMALFLAINTSSVTLLPLGAITIRASAGCDNPSSILVPSLLATITSTTVAIIASKFLAKRAPLLCVAPLKKKVAEEMEGTEQEKTKKSSKILGWVLLSVLVLAVLYFTVHVVVPTVIVDGVPTLKDGITAITKWLIPLLVVFFLFFGYFKGIPLYETISEGAKDGFSTAIRIIPFMVAIFVAIGLIRASGTLDLLNTLLKEPLSAIGMPAEALPMALIRPLSGSGAFGIMSEIVTNNPNSFVADLVSVMQGSTETTFYVLAVYFGAAGVTKTRHALPAALLADAAGILSALFFTHLFLG